MRSVTFKLKVLTPLFMGGADPTGQPELRAASIRGAMRFWFRAMAGTVTTDPREIYRLESEIFGNTERKSKVVVRVKTINSRIIHKGREVPLRLAVNKDVVEKLNGKEKRKYEELKKIHGDPFFESKIDYAYKLNFLAYLANMGLTEYNKSKKGFVWSRSGFDVNTIFKVEFTTVNDETLKLIENLFPLAVQLGGFGARWRHGFGSCEIQTGPNTNWQIALENTKKWLLDRVNAIGELPELPETEFPEFLSFRKGSYRIWSNRLRIGFSKWQEILTYIGLKYREFRIREGGYTEYGYTRDYITLLNADGFSEEDLLNDVFGLPIQYKKGNIVEVYDYKKEVGRRASPLILHIEPRSKLVRATLFKSRIVPDWPITQYYAKFGRKIDLIPPTIEDFSRIEEFVESLFANNRRHHNV